MRIRGFYAAVLHFLPFILASQQPRATGGIEVAALIARASSSFDLNPTNKEGNTATTAPTSSAASTKTTQDGSSSVQASTSVTGSESQSTGRSTAKDSEPSGSHTITSSGHNSNSNSTKTNHDSSAKTTSYETTKTFNPVLPPGGVSMVTPNPLSNPSQYYRISEYVTFAWEYTSLSATPSAVNVLVSCSTNSETYTVATHVPVANATQTVVWDTQQDAQELIMGTYTLVVYDATKAVTAVPSAGYLNTFNQLYFGMYPGESYTPIAKFQCATCGSGASSLERHTVGFVCGMAVLTVLSFGWYGGVAGLC